MAYKTGTKLSSDVTAAATSACVGTAPDTRRLYDFSDGRFKIIKTKDEIDQTEEYLKTVTKHLNKLS